MFLFLKFSRCGAIPQMLLPTRCCPESWVKTYAHA